MSWQAFYQSDLQAVWALVVVPVAFVLRRGAGVRPPGPGVEPHAARFVAGWALVFALETIADPVVTGPLLRVLGAADGALGRVVLFAFVFLGDLRVFLLMVGVMAPENRLRRTLAVATAWTLAVPAFTWAAMTVLGAGLGPLPETVLWLVYEVGFTILALLLRLVLGMDGRRPEVRAFVRAVLAYAAVYYALWAAADGIILRGVDGGWALRILPNQLYYACFVPVVWWRFFSPRYASTNTSTQAAR